MINEDDILISNYLKGELSKDDINAVEKRMRLDEDFREKIMLEKELSNFFNEKTLSIPEIEPSVIKDYKTILNNESTIKLKETIESVDKGFKYNNKRRFKRVWASSVIAASLILFFAINLFINSNVSTEDLYEEYIKVSSLPSFVDRSETVNNRLIEAQNLFEAESYEQAKILFEETLDHINDSGTLYLYTGITQMELNEFSKAENTFNKLIESNLIDAEKGYWYKSLLYLRMNNIEASKKELNIIISKSLFNTKQAQLLLEDLD